MSDSFSTAWTIACQAPLSMGFPRQEYWSGLPFPSPGDLLNPGIKPVSAAWQAASLPLSHLGSSWDKASHGLHESYLQFPSGQRPDSPSGFSDASVPCSPSSSSSSDGRPTSSNISLCYWWESIVYPIQAVPLVAIYHLFLSYPTPK